MSTSSIAIVDTPNIDLAPRGVRTYPSEIGLRVIVDLGPIRLNLNAADAANLGTELLEAVAKAVAS